MTFTNILIGLEENKFWNEMCWFFNITWFMNWYFYRVFHGLGNTFVIIYVLIISVMYLIVTARLFLICWRLIWSCQVDWVFSSFDFPNITSAACTGGDEDFLVIRSCVLSCITCTLNLSVWCLYCVSFCVFSPAVAKRLLNVLAVIVGFW